jgi:hypothetical protein
MGGLMRSVHLCVCMFEAEGWGRSVRGVLWLGHAVTPYPL